MSVSIRKMNFDYLVGQTIGSSVLLRMLDRGTMSVLFAAYQKTLKRQIAVKILPKQILTPKMAELFRHEAEAAAFLSHPCIIPIFEVGDSGDFLYFTMPLVKGKSLARLMSETAGNVLPSRRLLPVRTALKIVVKVLDALDYANLLGIVHRDIKPGNILIESHSHRPIVTDFGLARSYAVTGGRQDCIVVGTPAYMPPEQIMSGIVDGRADVYAAGVMLFEMLCGALPYPAHDSATKLLKIKLKLQNRLFLKAPSKLNPAVDAALDEIIFKAVQYDKDRRYKSCRAFAEAIDRYTGTGSWQAGAGL